MTRTSSPEEAVSTSVLEIMSLKKYSVAIFRTALSCPVDGHCECIPQAKLIIETFNLMTVQIPFNLFIEKTVMCGKAGGLR